MTNHFEAQTGILLAATPVCALGTHAGFLAFALASTIAAVAALVAYVLWRRSAAPQPEGQAAA